MSKPRLLDLFSGAGGAAVGYHRAGFEVVGVDLVNQPNYPFEFVQADIFAAPFRIECLAASSDAIHASPPCQAFTAYNRARPGNGQRHPDLIASTREMLDGFCLPYVIENVEGAPLWNPTMICGSMFDPPLDVRRHRFFETSWPLEPPTWPCRHKLWSARFPAATNRAESSRQTVAVGQWNTTLRVQAEAMGIDWMTVPELSQSVPPRYTELIGLQLAQQLQKAAA